MTPVLNLANFVTLSRLLITPFLYFSIMNHDWPWAFGLCLFGGLTDFLDGYIARLCKTLSVFGERFDPFADKIMMTAIYFAMGMSQIIPLWCVIIILLRDLLIILGALIVMIRRQKIPLHPLFLSKLNTVFQILLAGWLVAFQYLSTFMYMGYTLHLFTNILLYVTLALTFLSGIQYAQRFASHITKT